MNKNLLVLLFTLCFTFYCHGQIGFEENVVIDSSYNPDGIESTIFEDLDNDGDVDLIIGSSHNGEKVVWYENTDGQGNFSNQRIITTDISGLTQVYVSDINGDGYLDIMSASSVDGKISWYENLNGTGTFSVQQVIALGGLVESISSSDIDGDGDLDVLAMQSSGAVWYENLDGLANFGEEQLITTTIFPNYSYGNISSSDLDGDGDMDIFIPETFNNSEFNWYQNTDGQGSFIPVLTNMATSTPDNNIDVTVNTFIIDFDQDGDIDIVTPETKYWFENDGSGVFGDRQAMLQEASGTNNGYIILTLGDIDGDGDLDAVTRRETPTWLSFHENPGDGQPLVYNSVIDDYFYTPDAVLADINTDGGMDVVTIAADRDIVAWHENLDGLGNYGQDQIIAPHVDVPKSVFSADFDGDGDMDFVSIFYGDNEIAWFQNTNGQGDFSEPISVTKNISAGTSVSAADLDGDGDFDIIASGGELFSSITRKLVWYENLDGLGNFGTEQIILADGTYTEAIHVADLDNDNDIDILVVSAVSDKVIWFENINGNGIFSTEQIITTETDSPQSVSTADLDSDGDLDVLTTSLIDDKLAWYENTNGTGDFGVQQVISISGNGAIDAKAADFDNDGDLDIVLASRLDDTVAWYENLDGNGVFGAENIIYTDDNPGQAIKVIAVDVDNDGDLDVLSASVEYAGVVVWFENVDGYGAFGEPQPIITGDADLATGIYMDIDVADVNQDGMIDILSAFEESNTLVWSINQGVVLNEIYGIISTDLNNDGCSSGNVPTNGIMVLTDNTSGNLATFSTNSGVYQFFVGEGSYTTNATSNLPAYFEVSPSSFDSDFVGIGNTEMQDFCIIPTASINDLNISIYPSINDPRPGFNTTYQIVYKNVGTTQLGGDVTFEFDDAKLDFLNANETVASQTANTLTFNFTDLNPFETRTIDVVFNLFAPPTTNIGEVLITTATINPVTGDNTPEDNVFTLNQTVIGSYDPNDIRVLEGEQILLEDADKYLHYIIRFQNTGTASAINVHVENVLDHKLDWTTMQLESLSHTGSVEIKDGVNVSFIFDDINLADSTSDEPNSHGFIAYKIKPKSDVVVGNVIHNTADIFFDFNPAIVTNTVSTEIVDALSIAEFQAASFIMYPNPANNHLTISGNSVIDTITIYDVNGRALKAINYDANVVEMNITDLSSGIYFIQIQAGEEKEVKKFIKK
ncbi:T9SS type A sorting domain-containing protein [Lacinutrix himadriensis]|uniref:T9SS type A sorting domain-containing protein n=1 Tax=Lacinutrix himadriensis TaxID=641549 RepID=UPI0006E16BA3|nr:T9SS type A sorting domain-containing protein [Lacinutrix himadriensis]